MNILLLSMPDSFEHMPSIVLRMPNGGLSSLAGNIDPHNQAAVADLILVQHQHEPWFVLRHAQKMMAHAFRGCTMKTFLGLEDEHEAFQRYRAIRQRERNYV